MSNYALTLLNSIKRGNTALWTCTDRMKETWQRSIRAVGGFWLGTAEYKGTRDDLLEMFLEGMMREIREDVGGLVTWEGYIAEMQLTLDGVTYIRSMVNVSNAVKEIYTRIGDNLLTNGGAESGPWTVYNGATVTQSTAWVNTGTYSCKIEVADTVIRGAIIQTLTIAAGVSYDITGAINAATAGSWRIAVNRTDTGASLCHDSTHGAPGDKTIKMNIPATNTYAGTVDFIITSEAHDGILYGDSFTFQASPTAAQTQWYADTNSASEYGRMELAVLDVAMTNAAANAKAFTQLGKLAWPKALPPNEFTLVGNDLTGNTGDKLALTIHGYVHTLANKYSLTVGTDVTTNHVKAIINESEFIHAGSINPNTLSYQIDDRAPIKHWQILMDIINAGDTVGARWVGGVGGARYFDYLPADNQIAYHYQGGKFYNAAKGELEPWFAEPGHLLYLDDAPAGPTQISGNVEDDPHLVFISEVEMGPPSDKFPNGTLTFRHEAAF